MVQRDLFGMPYERDPERMDLATRSIVHSVRDRASVGSILSNVTPQRIVSIFREADNGYPARQIELAQDVRERDEHVNAVDQIRRLAVQGMDFVIAPGDPADELSKQAAEAFSREWEVMDPRTVVGQMMDAVLEQWSVHRCVWQTDGLLAGRRHWRIESIEQEDGRRLVWPQAATTSPGDLTSIVPGISRDWSYTDAEPLTAGKYLVHSYRAVRGRPGRGALVRCIAALWMFKRFSLTDLAQLIEQWGRPWPSLNYDPKASPEEVQTWIEALADSMADRVIAVPAGASLQVTDAKASGADTPHTNLYDLCNRGISKVFVGSTTIADAAANNDSVSSPTHAQVREDIRNADAFAVAASIRRSLMVPWTLWNYGPGVASPMMRPNTESTPEPTQRGAVYEIAARLGMKVKSRQLYSELGIEMPEGTPEVLTLSQQSAPVNPFGMGMGQA